MKFLKQVKVETKNILSIKFILILSILILAFCIGWPIYNSIKPAENNMWDYARPMVRAVMDYNPGYSDEQTLTIDGTAIEPGNPFYYEIKQLKGQIDVIDSNSFAHEGARELRQKLLEEMLVHNLRLARSIYKYDDYRLDIVWQWQKAELRLEKFIHEHITSSDFDALIEAVRDYYYYDPLNTETFDNKFVKISSTERLKAIEQAEEYFDKLYTVIESNDFARYIEFRVDLENDNIESNKKMIAMLEGQIIDNPVIEEELKWQIEDLKRQNVYIQENTIPLLLYRLEKNIIPNDGSWQNIAISDIETSRAELQYLKPVSEEEFNRELYLKEQYQTYAIYIASINKQIESYNTRILIAENSIESNMPDLKYVPSGARNQTLDFLMLGSIVGVLAIMLGGWMMASEFQLGTIRLLMIRPISRTKMLLAKFLSALILCIALYLAGIILNFVMNGIMFGFSDYSNPSYSASGQVGFLAYYVPKMLACIIPIIFAYCVAFMLSTLVKNIAVAISVPAVLFVGCVIVMSIIKGRVGVGTFSSMEIYWNIGQRGLATLNWIAWTPVPFILLSDFFTLNSVITTLIGGGVPIYLGYGLSLLAALSIICTAVSVWVFRKRDITQ